MRVVVSDAYSTSNVGDGELVRLTVDSVLQRYDTPPVVLATDPESFDVTDTVGIEYLSKPLSRQSWRTRGLASRIAWLAAESVALASAALVPFLPQRARRRAASGLGRLIRAPWFVAICNSNVLVAVGGGYIGDKYLRESLITLICFRFADSLGQTVETMPLSISSAKSRLLRRALISTGGVQWRSREERTHETLCSLGLNSELVPDLAWLNAGEPTGADTPREGIAVAPVGSSFYTDSGETPRAWSTLEPLLSSLPLGASVRLIPMHRWDPRLGDGEDDRACQALAGLVTRSRSDLAVDIVDARTYADVRRAMAMSALAICERLHAALAATTSATPVTVIAYEPKHRGVMGLAGLEKVCDIGHSLDGSYSDSQLAAAAKIQRRLVEEAVMAPCVSST